MIEKINCKERWKCNNMIILEGWTFIIYFFLLFFFN